MDLVKMRISKENLGKISYWLLLDSGISIADCSDGYVEPKFAFLKSKARQMWVEVPKELWDGEFIVNEEVLCIRKEGERYKLVYEGGICVETHEESMIVKNLKKKYGDEWKDALDSYLEEETKKFKSEWYGRILFAGVRTPLLYMVVAYRAVRQGGEPVDDFMYWLKKQYLYPSYANITFHRDLEGMSDFKEEGERAYFVLGDKKYVVYLDTERSCDYSEEECDDETKEMLRNEVLTDVPSSLKEGEKYYIVFENDNPDWYVIALFIAEPEGSG